MSKSDDIGRGVIAKTGVCVYDIKLISAPARWSPIGRCRGDYAPTVAAGDCIGEEVVVEVGERGCRWVTGAGETASLVRSIGVVMCTREAARGVGVGWAAADWTVCVCVY